MEVEEQEVRALTKKRRCKKILKKGIEGRKEWRSLELQRRWVK